MRMAMRVITNALVTITAISVTRSQSDESSSLLSSRDAAFPVTVEAVTVLLSSSALVAAGVGV